MIVVWFILACLTSGAFGAALMALLQIAKQTDIADGNELSLEQEDKIVVIDDLLCHSIPQNHCDKYQKCEQCQKDWLRGMEAKIDR